jgi:phage terminase small subunit
MQTTEDGETIQIAAGGERYYWTGGLRRQRPELADISDADRRISSWAAKFGMTPADRSRVSASPEETRNAFADFG